MPFPARQPIRLRGGAAVRSRRGAALLAAGVAGLLLAAGCATPTPRKGTFMGQADTIREPVAEPEGLNPLGALETCSPEPAKEGPHARVLVSRPERFTEEASVMIVALREALAANKEGIPPPRMQLSRTPLNTVQEARAEGVHCGALIVLWERHQSRTLELTLPYPARVPLRGLVQSTLCEFGDHSEQATILYYTILGLTAMLQNDYDRAHYFLSTARSVDVQCMRLPAGGPPAAAPAGTKN